MLENYQKLIDQAVLDGVITPEQYLVFKTESSKHINRLNNMLEKMDTAYSNILLSL